MTDASTAGMATSAGTAEHPPSPSAVRKPRSTRVDWVELRGIADKVQQALDAARELHGHSDYECVLCWLLVVIFH